MILGAGFSRRFGADKRLQPLDGSTVAATTVAKYSAVFEHVRLVVREDDEALVALTPEVEHVVARDAASGMGHSLAAGFGDLEWRWTFVALLDMPYVEAATLQELRDVALIEPESCVIRPVFDDIPGHPIGIANNLYEDVRACTGDEGARAIIANQRGATRFVPVSDPGVHRDIDVPADLA